jgi:DNA polymerase III subunit delta'
MSLIERYPMQPKVTKMLLNSYEKDRLAHAYLFEGEKGTPKLDLAIDFAKLLYCEAPVKPCNNCISCMRIDHRNHPNIILIEPDGNTLKKEQILYLQKEYAKTNLEEGPKVYIIDQIDKMSVNASNSILKFIEEPLEDTYTILITDQVHQILPTIISRCQLLSFQPIDTKQLREQLIEKGFEQEVAAVSAELTNDLNQAIEICQDESIHRIITLVNQIGGAMLKGDKNLVLVTEKSSVDLYNSKKLIHYFLDILLLMLRDFHKVKMGNENVVLTAQLDMVKPYKDLINLEQNANDIKEILRAKTRLEQNANTMLLLDNLLIKLNKVV